MRFSVNETSVLSIIRSIDTLHSRAVDGLIEMLRPRWFERRPKTVTSEVQAIEGWLYLHKTLIVDFWRRSNEIFDTARNHTLRHQFLTALKFPEMHYRYFSVKQAHKDTFEWLFDEQFESLNGSVSFKEWLTAKESKKEGLFWIRGKPGSGKSTLMRLLADDPRTSSLAQKWSRGKRVSVQPYKSQHLVCYVRFSTRSFLQRIRKILRIPNLKCQVCSHRNGPKVPGKSDMRSTLMKEN